MTDYPRVAFVSAPDAGATVRLDLNEPIGAAGCQVNADGFSLGAPSLESDPTAVGQAWGYRSITLTPRITGTKSAALAALSALSREQLRAENWLLVQLTALHLPVWFKVYRSAPQPLSLDEVDVAGLRQDAWETTLSLVADAFGYGTRVVAATSVTVEPKSTATNPMRYALPAIQGDAPTGLRITMVGAGSAGGPTWTVGCCSGDSTMVDPIQEIGTSDSLIPLNGTGTPSTTSGSAYSGGSYRAMTIAAASPNLLQRLSGTHTGLVPGRYKIYLRAELDGATDRTFLLQYEQYVSTLSTVRGSVVSVPVTAGVAQGWIDLGDFTFPFGVDVPSGIAPMADPTFNLYVGTADGSAATGRLDAFKFVPVDGPAVVSTQLMKMQSSDNIIKNAVTGTLDADTESYWSVTTGTGNLRPGGSSLAGTFPVAEPSASKNILQFIPLDFPGAAHATGNQASVANPVVVTASYHPRYVHLPES